VLAQLFNEDYTQIAGWIPGPGGKGWIATAFDLRTGKRVGAGSDPDQFASSPEDGRPVFHQDKLWYVDRNEQIRSRAVEQSPDLAEKHGSARGRDLIMAGSTPWSGREPASIVVHPSGELAAENWGSEHQLQIRKRDADEYDGRVLSQGAYPGSSQPPRGSVKVPECTPESWIDSTTLICSGSHQVWRLTLAPALDLVTEVSPLLPDTDRVTRAVVLSSDLKSMAFLSELGDAMALYRQPLAPGNKPVKVADLPEANLTYLIAWS
jgi:hypothetical protein